MGDHLKEEVDTENEEFNTEVKVKKDYVMTEARTENLRRARERATLLRQQLKEKKQPKEKPKSKMEQKIIELEAKTKDVIKINDNANDTKREDKKVASDVDKPKTEEPKNETPKKPIPDKPIEPLVKQEPKIETKIEPKVEPKIEPKIA